MMSSNNKDGGTSLQNAYVFISQVCKQGGLNFRYIRVAKLNVHRILVDGQAKIIGMLKWAPDTGSDLIACSCSLLLLQTKA